jgi:hypothetical protein
MLKQQLTVGAQSIAHLAQNYACSLNSISGHRCPRELWFFLFERSLIGEKFKVFKKIYNLYVIELKQFELVPK